jgi:hypothetical protein
MRAPSSSFQDPYNHLIRHDNEHKAKSSRSNWQLPSVAMRLINIRTLQLKEFFGADVPHYAILSHRWEEEVTFQDLTGGTGKNMIGWKKIVRCCQLALRENLEWAWIDSCCIDKTSSSELSEAINSMFRWYRDAEICYAYLSDVFGPLEEASNMAAFRFSKWFTRGWTLQELLASDELMFFDKDWLPIGTKDELFETISSVTGIKHLFNFEDASVAQKMSWAAKRETTRLEDQAYCLLGIFGVNMPPLYGEGPNAFFRLQLEIMKISNDESLFAWEDDFSKTVTSGGLLAPSPIFFRFSSNIILLAPPWVERPPYSITNKGLEISLQLERYVSQPPHPIWKAPLNCAREDYDNRKILYILLERDGTGTDNYRRVETSKLPSYDLEPQVNNKSPSKALQVIYVKQPQIYSSTRTYCYFGIDLRSLCSAGWEIKDRVVLSSELGRWGSDSLGYLQLKLSNSSAGVQILRSRGAPPNDWMTPYHRDSVDVLLLILSCVGKEGKAILDISHWEYKDGNPVPLVERLKKSERRMWGTKVISKDTRTLQDTFPSGRSIKASLWKEGISGGRELFAIKLEED